jgi:hypothetical protein
MRLLSKLALSAFILLWGNVLFVSAETTFLANFNNPDGLTGNARFSPDFNVGGTFTVSTRSTATGETVDFPSGTAPNLSPVKRVLTGASSLDIHGGRDGLFYTNLPVGNVNRREGTAEGFFLTPYSLSGNTEPRTFLSGWVSFTTGARWYFQISATGNRLVATFGDSSSNPAGAVSFQSLPFAAEEWRSEEWHHVAVTWNAAAGAFQLFVDGRLVGRTSGNLPATSATESATGNRVYVGMGSAGTGALNSGQGSNLEGWVDSVRFDNTVLYDGAGFAVGNQVFTPPAAESWRSLGVFNSSQTVWQSPNAVTPVLKTFDHRTRGYEFTCDFQTVVDRCSWEAATNLNLLGPISLSNWVYVTNGSGIGEFAISFRSGNGWYVWSAPVYEGWNNLAVDIQSLGIEGSPDGVSQIDFVRITISKRPQSIGEAKVALHDVEGSAQLREDRAFEYPEYDLPSPARLERRDPNTNKLLESRVILDEGGRYLLEGADALLDRISLAGFNVLFPNVWHGKGAVYRSQTALIEPQWVPYFQGSVDPLDDLIEKAHARGMEVHGWYNVALRQSDIYPEFAEPGTPPEAFDLQNPAFRDFIVREIIGFASQYNVDGILLDYIRTVGTSFSPTASNLYFQRYGRSIDELRLDPMPPDVRARLLEWQRDAVSDIVKRVREGINAIKPGLTISVFGQAYPKPMLSEQGRNEWLWVENDWIDVDFDGDYYPIPEVALLAEVRRNSPYPERITRMLGNYNEKNLLVFARNADVVAKQVDYFLRKFPERGSSLYIYNLLDDAQIAALRAGPFRTEALPFFNLKDDFESKAAGSNLGTDLRWIGYNAPPSFVPNVYIADNIAARGSNHSVVFKDAPGSNQVYWLNLASSKAAATIEFDVYLDDRNPRGGANFEVRPSTGTGGARELSLYLAQQSPTTWMLSVWKKDGIVAYARNIPLKTWHRIKFRNNVLNHTFTLALNGNILAADVAYGGGINPLNQIDTIQWRNLSSDEDVYIDNIVIREP